MYTQAKLSSLFGLIVGALMGIGAAFDLVAAAEPASGARIEVSASFEATPCPAGDAALQQIKDGNSRYVAEHSTHPDLGQNRRAETAAKGQHPVATIVACSDSREPVELIFDQGIGALFIVRVAGNVCATDELGSAEYGVEHLHTPLLVVMGHSKCGAVTAAVNNDTVHGNIEPLIAQIRPAADAAKSANPKLSGDDLINAAIRSNVLMSMEKILTKSAALHESVKTGKVKLVGAVYHIEDGSIEWLGPHPREGALLAAAVSEGH